MCYQNIAVQIRNNNVIFKIATPDLLYWLGQAAIQGFVPQLPQDWLSLPIEPYTSPQEYTDEMAVIKRMVPQTCDICGEYLLFYLAYQEQCFPLRLFELLDILKSLEQFGVIPCLPYSWWLGIFERYGNRQYLS
ncbi:hypothetical protein FW755_09510 [Lonepinella koalarum]|uniref:hypothetical protein n=1 Tax=Lonepinella koalarum TaxID=53417 RepID=UPI0011E3BD87|nr:hypothetical protein [Lonepinella koalarum]TYG35312.1 hypothetical protein FW755_09510 [Lonepinella koalarum]